MMFVMINDTLQPTHTALSNVDQPVYLVRIGNFFDIHRHKVGRRHNI